MLDANGLEVRKIVTESQKAFILKCLSFENGLFILVAEGIDRIGSLAVSIAASNKSNTATVSIGITPLPNTKPIAKDIFYFFFSLLFKMTH
jgi:hypothetical protein